MLLKNLSFSCGGIIFLIAFELLEGKKCLTEMAEVFVV